MEHNGAEAQSGQSIDNGHLAACDCTKCRGVRAEAPKYIKAPGVNSEGAKDDIGKVRMDLLPPEVLWSVAKVLTKGAKAYGDRNWENGIAYGRVFGAMMRHAWKWWWGETYCEKDGQHHLASVLACGMFLLHYDLNRENYTGFDDRKGCSQEWDKLEGRMYKPEALRG